MTLTRTLYLFLLCAVLCGCTSHKSSDGYYWNGAEEYGTCYPPFMENISFPENGKGFSVSDGTAQLWADCTSMICADECPSLNIPDCEMVTSEQVFRAAGVKRKRYVILDTTYITSSMKTHYLSVAEGEKFFMLSYSYPAGDEKYSSFEGKYFGSFPFLKRKH